MRFATRRHRRLDTFREPCCRFNSAVSDMQQHSTSVAVGLRLGERQNLPALDGSS